MRVRGGATVGDIGYALYKELRVPAFIGLIIARLSRGLIRRTLASGYYSRGAAVAADAAYLAHSRTIRSDADTAYLA